MGVRDEIRDFLLARRARVTPGQVGLPARGDRRVAGLRREEVAELAGISLEYYIRLERGKARGFAGSDLDTLLRAQRIDHLVLTGVATSGVVLSTLRQAADLDYRLTVLADACLDNDPEVHTVLTTKVFPAQADVTTVAGWRPPASA